MNFKFLNNVFFKRISVNQIPEQTFPAINIKTFLPFSYPSKYKTMQHIIELKEKDKIGISYEKLRLHLAQQIQNDKHLLFKQKEIVFIGRSNVGKSMLINTLFGEKVSKVSKTQGSTKKLFFHKIYKDQGYLVDAPGYGYVACSVQVKKKLTKILFDYLKISTRICKIYILINLEHGLKSTDHQFLQKIDTFNLKVQVVFTKCDLVNQKELYDKYLAIGQQLQKYNCVEPLLLGVSSKTGFGIDYLKYSLIHAFTEYKQRDLKGEEDLVITDLLGQNGIKKLKGKDKMIGKDIKKFLVGIQAIRYQKQKKLLSNRNTTQKK